jgi:hypothetical protein
MTSLYKAVVSTVGVMSFMLLGMPVQSHARQNVKLGDDFSWDRGAMQLARGLEQGHPRDYYPARTLALGFMVTSVNYDDSTYFEYEVVKGDESYEVQINIDPTTNRATDVNVENNLWQSDFTEWVLDNPRRAAQLSRDDPDYLMVIARSYRSSDRDRSQLQQMVRNLEQLPVGRTEQFYRNAITDRGYRILKRDIDDAGATQWHLSKKGRTVALTVYFDPDTAQSTGLRAYPLWWEASPRQLAASEDASRWSEQREELADFEE